MLNDAKEAIESAKQGLMENYFKVENRDDIPESAKISRIINITSATCAGVAIQPIPFADFFVLTPLQGYMGTRIAAIRNVPISEHSAREIVLEILSVVGMGLLAQQLVIGGYKTFIPFAGGIFTIPIVYGLTYAIGRVMDEYFVRMSKGQRMEKQVMKDIWGEALKQGKAQGKKQKDNIRKENLAEDDPNA